MAKHLLLSCQMETLQNCHNRLLKIALLSLSLTLHRKREPKCGEDKSFAVSAAEASITANTNESMAIQNFW
jgi:hypothetical protein